MSHETPGDARVAAILRRSLPRLLPLLFLMTFASYLDRGNVSVLATSINASLDMSATTFGFAVGLFFWGYVIFEIPSNVALHRFGGRIWLARIMISWGLVTGLTALVQTDWQFAIARFLLGAAEAGLIPGILYYLTSWVPRHRQQATFSLFQVAVPVSLLFTALVTSALLAAVQPFVSSDLEWRWVLVIQGVLTILIGVATLIWLPRRPREARWLSADDAAFIERSIEAEGENTESTESAGRDLSRVWRVLRSGRAWYLSITVLLMLTGSWAVIFWLPQIVTGYFKTDAVTSGFISAIPYAVAIVALLVTRVTASRTGDRRFHLLIALGLGAVGLLVGATVPSGILAVAGLSIALAAVQVSIPLLIGVQSLVFTGVMTATVLAMVNSIGSFGGTIGPLIFGVSVDTFGGVTPALGLMAAVLAIAAVMAFFSERVALGRDRSLPLGRPVDGFATKGQS